MVVRREYDHLILGAEAVEEREDHGALCVERGRGDTARGVDDERERDPRRHAPGAHLRPHEQVGAGSVLRVGHEVAARPLERARPELEVDDQVGGRAEVRAAYLDHIPLHVHLCPDADRGRVDPRGVDARVELADLRRGSLAQHRVAVCHPPPRRGEPLDVAHDDDRRLSWGDAPRPAAEPPLAGPLEPGGVRVARRVARKQHRRLVERVAAADGEARHDRVARERHTEVPHDSPAPGVEVRRPRLRRRDLTDQRDLHVVAAHRERSPGVVRAVRGPPPELANHATRLPPRAPRVRHPARPVVERLLGCHHNLRSRDPRGLAAADAHLLSRTGTADDDLPADAVEVRRVRPIDCHRRRADEHGDVARGDLGTRAGRPLHEQPPLLEDRAFVHYADGRRSIDHQVRPVVEPRPRAPGPVGREPVVRAEALDSADLPPRDGHPGVHGLDLAQRGVDRVQLGAALHPERHREEDEGHSADEQHERPPDPEHHRAPSSRMPSRSTWNLRAPLAAAGESTRCCLVTRSSLVPSS